MKALSYVKNFFWVIRYYTCAETPFWTLNNSPKNWFFAHCTTNIAWMVGFDASIFLSLPQLSEYAIKMHIYHIWSSLCAPNRR